MAEQSLAEKITDAVGGALDAGHYLKVGSAVVAVLNLHCRSIFPASSGERQGQHYCASCTASVDHSTLYVRYPCQTVEAIAEALGVSVDG